MTEYITLVPAYGRDYKNQREVKEAWAAGKDFIIAHLSQYINNKNGLPKGTVLNIRFKQHRNICQIIL